MPRDTQHFQTTLVRLANAGADAGHIANEAVSMWRDVDAALSPIIGQRGVAALFRRSVSLIRPEHAWLAAVQEGAAQPDDDFAALRSTLSQQTSSNAVAANNALLQKFVDLLTNLIGESLTERLLRSVWDNPSSDGAVQEISP